MSGTTTTDDSSTEHRVASVNEIVVKVDDVIETMKRNYRDKDQQRNHVLRITPPFEGTHTASTHVSQAHTRYPSNVTHPYHMKPETFLTGYTDPDRIYKELDSVCEHPPINESRSRFRDEYNTYDEHGEPLPIEGELQEKWNEWWDTEMEVWEDQVRHALKNTTTLKIHDRHPDVESTTVDVTVE